MCQFSGETDNFNYFSSNLPKNEFWDRNFKNLSPDSESAPPRFLTWQFSVKTDNFEVFGLNLGKLPSYVQYFGFNNVEGITESWVEAEMSWVEVNWAGWRLKWAGWRWMEVDGGSWNWVEVGVQFSNTQKINLSRKVPITSGMRVKNFPPPHPPPKKKKKKNLLLWDS